MNGKVTGLAHIGIQTSDMDRSIAFYRDTLGFVLDHRTSLRDGAVELGFLKVGHCTVELVKSGDGSGVKERSAGIVDHVALAVEDVDSLAERLTEQGVRFETEKPMDLDLMGGAKAIFFHGPDGERLEFFEVV